MDRLGKEWFELADHRRRSLSRSVWVPVYASYNPIKEGSFPEIGHVEETLIVGSAVIFNHNKDAAEKLDWHYWPIDNSGPFVRSDGSYFESESFYEGDEERLGFRLVLSQFLNSSHPRQVLLNQDFIMAYGLLEEADRWVRPNEGYEEVVRFRRNSEGSICLIEIRAEYLKDYLAARKASLRVYSYRQRRAVLENDPKFGWPEDNSITSEEHDRCEVRCYEITSSGDVPGTTWAMLTVRRTDVDPDEEVPDFSGNDDESTASESTTGVRGEPGDRFHIMGELWRGEWIEPAAESFRIGYGDPPETLMVQLDGGGPRVDLQTLDYEEVGKYLWFNPSVINALLSHRGASLRWYTRDTGGIAPGPGTFLHFGVNRLGLINAYAYDIARAPLWHRRVWVAHNCRPDGGVSAELLSAQMETRVADTTAPEKMLLSGVGWLSNVFERKFGFPLLRDHHEILELESKLHRFRAIDESGIRSLAKDIVKFSIERIEKGSLLRATGEENTKLGTLKLLEKLLGKYTSEDYARRRMSPLFGVYDLRGTDAHLSTSDIEDCYKRIGVDRSAPYVLQATQLLEQVAVVFGVSGGDLRKLVPEK